MKSLLADACVVRSSTAVGRCSTHQHCATVNPAGAPVALTPSVGSPWRSGIWPSPVAHPANTAPRPAWCALSVVNAAARLPTATRSVPRKSMSPSAPSINRDSPRRSIISGWWMRRAGMPHLIRCRGICAVATDRTTGRGWYSGGKAPSAPLGVEQGIPSRQDNGGLPVDCTTQRTARADPNGAVWDFRGNVREEQTGRGPAFLPAPWLPLSALLPRHQLPRITHSRCTTRRRCWS